MYALSIFMAADRNSVTVITRFRCLYLGVFEQNYKCHLAKNHFSAAISLHQAIFQKSSLPVNDFYFMEMNFPKSFQTNALSSFHAWICDSLTKRSFLFLVFDSLSFSIVLTFGDLLKLWIDLNSIIDKFLEIFKSILQSNCNGDI